MPRTSGTAIQQVLMHVLSVGCDAMVARRWSPGEVRVATLRKDQRVEVHLEFPPVLDFHQRDAQRTLLLSRAIVEPHGGEPDVDLVLQIILGVPLRPQPFQREARPRALAQQQRQAHVIVAESRLDHHDSLRHDRPKD